MFHWRALLKVRGSMRLPLPPSVVLLRVLLCLPAAGGRAALSASASATAVALSLTLL